MKKIIAILLTLMIVLSLATTAMAADITVNKAMNGETYTAYKIFDVVISEDGENYAYTIASNSVWKNAIENYKVGEETVFTLTPGVSDPDVLVVTYPESFNTEAAGADLADYLAAYLADNDIEAAATVTAADGKAAFTDLNPGYYFVDTTLGSLCALFTTDASVDLQEKNSIPGIEKTQSDDALQIGETVTYTITVTDSKGTDAAITVHDVMEAGLTLVADSFAIKVGEIDVDAANYTIVTADLTDGCTFEIVFTADFVKTLKENEAVTITYDAILNEKAEIAPETNDNKTWLNYSNQTTEEVIVKLSTYEFDLDKTDSTNAPLIGAKFKLYDAETAGNVIKVVGSNGIYAVAQSAETEGAVEEMETDANGQLTVIGLDNKIYYLEETAAPAGYNKLTERYAVDLSNGSVVRGTDDGNEATYGIQIINQAGAELPSTGGVGTTLFYIIGGMMLAAAAVLLVTKKRVASGN